MFRALEKLQDGDIPQIQEKIPQTKSFINSYITLQTDSTTKYDTYIRPEKKSISIPKYSFLTSIQSDGTGAVIKEDEIYNSILPHKKYVQPAVEYSKLQSLASRAVMSKAINEGNLAKPIALSGSRKDVEVFNAIDSTERERSTKEFEKYSFCSELIDSSRNIPLECLQQEFKRQGGKEKGLLYPKTVELYNKLNWKTIKDRITEIAAGCQSNDDSLRHDSFMALVGKVPPKKSMRRIPGIEVLWFDRGTNTYVDRITELNSYSFNAQGDNLDFKLICTISPPKPMNLQLQLEKDGILFLSDGDQIPQGYKNGICWNLDKKQRLIATWNGISQSKMLYSPCDMKEFKPIPNSWLGLTQEANAPIFSWEGKKNEFSERRFPNLMALTMSPKIKVVDPGIMFPSLLQLRFGASSGFATVNKNILINSWRTLTCAFLAFPGNGILYKFGPLTIIVSGVRITFKWSSATLEAEHTFSGLVLDGTTPYLACIGMRSDLENIYPNRLTFYCASFDDWQSGRVTTEKFEEKGKTFTTKDLAPIYNISDSAQLCFGDSLQAANVAVAWFRIFDYELTSVDVVRDVKNVWERY